MTGTRFIAAMKGLAIVLPLMILGGLPGTALVIAVAIALSLDEYARMAFPAAGRTATLALAVPSLGLLLPPAFAWGGEAQAAGAGLAFIAVAMGVTLVPGATLDGAADRLGRAVFGIGWIAGLLPFLLRLREVPSGAAWVLLALGVGWAADTGAYFAGRKFGSRKLYPSVSPNKTWEGLYGGIAGAVLWVVLLQWTLLPSLSWLDVLVLAPAASVAGVLGDLCESLLKRAFGVKDSGTILPGHGGLLDRIDSVLFVAPVVWAWHVAVHAA